MFGGNWNRVIKLKYFKLYLCKWEIEFIVIWRKLDIEIEFIKYVVLIIKKDLFCFIIGICFLNYIKMFVVFGNILF